MAGVRGRADALASTIADEAVRAIGPCAQGVRIRAEIARRCAAAGVARPSDASICSRIAREASLAEPLAGEDVRLVVDRVRLAPARLADGGVGRPFLTLAVVDPHRRIVAHSVDEPSVPGPHVVAGMLVELDQRHASAPAIIVRAPALATGGWLDLRARLDEAGVQLATPVVESLRLGREINLLVGRRIADLPLGERGCRLVTASHEQPGIDGVRTGVDAAVASHNTKIARDVRPFSLTGFRGFGSGFVSRVLDRSPEARGGGRGGAVGGFDELAGRDDDGDRTGRAASRRWIEAAAFRSPARR